MGLWDKLKGELIDIIEWLDSSGDTMVWRFPRYENEIKYGAKLIVRESQAAVFVNEGQIADVFQPGTHTLETRNLPILSTIKGWKYGFSSPFKAEVYYTSMRRFTDLKWGTKNPVMLRDAEFGPVRLRAFGTYSMRVVRPDVFVREIAGTDAHFKTDEISDQLRNIIVSRFTDILGESKIPVLDLAANYDELGEFVRKRIAPEFEAYGLELPQLFVENVSLPPAVEEVLDKRTSMGVVGNLSAFTQFQAAQAIESAAKNPSGTAAAGIGMGMGFAMANQMGQALAPGGAPVSPGAGSGPGASPAGPPPLPSAGAVWFAAIGGQQAGPFDETMLASQAKSGLIQRETLVWRPGMANWTAAREVAELSPLFASVPPPLPPR
jgi:membrane protease subunit (stomatin/prohibitin family)